MSQKTIHSYHIFLFPFKFDGVFNPNEKWIGNSLSNSICQLYKYQNVDIGYYNIAKNKSYDEKEGKRDLSHLKLQNETTIIYSLPITEITLKLYHSGVGVLGFHLKNDSCESLQDVLNINQFGRRTYPPFLPLDKVKSSELADAIWLSNSEPQKAEFDTNNPFFENFETQTGLPAFIKGILPENFQKQISFLVHDKESTDYSTKSYFYDFVHPAIFGNSLESQSQDSVIDDRMYVICWYGNDKMAKYLQSQNRHLHTDDWYRFVFVDANTTTMQNDELRALTLQNSTYTRWLKYGTFYGVSRSSFVALTSSMETLQKPYVNAAFIPEHVRTLYYQMVELSLIQRTAVLRFASRAVKLSQRLGNVNENIVENLNQLNVDFIKFENELYFREVTAQIQGIELYDLIQSKMEIENEVKDLHKEINQLFQDVNTRFILNKEKEEKTRQSAENERQVQDNKRITLLSIALAIFSIPSLVIAFFDMGLFKNGIVTNYLIFSGLLFSMIILVAWVFRYVEIELSEKNRPWWLKRFVGLILFGAVFLLLPLLSYWNRDTIIKSNIPFPADTTRVQEQNPYKSIEVIIPTDTLKLGNQKLIIPEKKIKVTLAH